ncbi:NAD-dependent DNA ligase LigA [Mycoplasmopsis primatum]|uniref:NAD-dependent DNA ligase LigA n=1 Tax=Mycoplasmopsis primatum TaxID=55604 RepID=UPI0004970150|nr:NAD-dependent DNA ligase LigA [Mycoplasmopsis primatum]
MDKTVAQKRIKELVEILNQWNYEYYQLNKPSVSDTDYDKALLELENLENDFPELRQEDSPTQILGSFASERFSKVKHDKPMLSLAKAYSYDEVQKFIDNIEKTVPIDDITFNIEPKIDGLSISLLYKKGKLTRAVTRGNGIEGEDVTLNIYQIESIPKVINYDKTLEVRGEVFLFKKDFAKMNQNEKSFANARNAASGTLRQLDYKMVKKRNLSAFLYEVVDPINHNVYTQHQAIEFMKQLGIPTNPSSFVAEIEELEDAISNFAEIKNKLEYDADGLVIKLNDLRLWSLLGKTAKFPKHSIAFKYDVETATTKITKILTTVGRTGKITYIANTEPIELNQTTVRAATLHNYNFIKTMNINIGDDVNIIKAGEIIPKVIGLANEKTINSCFPKAYNCPSCKSLLVEYDDNVDQFCTNENCDEKNINGIFHFCSRDAMNIIGLGLSTIKDFYPKFIRNINDIFLLEQHYNELIKLPRYGEQKINNILASIEKSKNNDFHKVLFSLGIKHLGLRVAKLLSEKYNSFEQILNDENLSKIQDVKNIGPKIIDSLYAFIQHAKNRELLLYLDSIFTYNQQKQKISNIFENTTFVITGALSRPRDYFVKIIEQNSGVVASSVSSKTNILLTGENTGSKLDKAKKLNVKIINENEFYQLLKGDSLK